MKAKEYFNKYGVRLTNPKTQDAALDELIKDFAEETKQIIKIRGVKTNRGFIAVVKEMNDKWNALVRMCPILKKDGWKEVVKYNLSQNGVSFDELC